MRKRLLAILILTLAAGSVYAEAVSITVPWLTMDPGARPGGMGKAFVAIADDVHATYYNPAGLAFQPGHMVAAMHSDRSIDQNNIYYDYLGYAHNFENIGTFAISALYSNAGEVAKTKDSPQPYAYMSVYGFALNLSYAYPIISDSLALGGTVKYIYDHLSDSDSAAAIAGDIGMLWKTPLPKLSVGFNIMNLGSDLTYRVDDGVPQPLPRLAKVGLAYEIPFEDEFNEMRFAVDYSKYLVGLESAVGSELAEGVIGVGAEYWYGGIVGLRVGYYYDDAGHVEGTSFGVSLQYGGFQFDFAQQPEGELFGMQNRFSFSYRF